MFEPERYPDREPLGPHVEVTSPAVEHQRLRRIVRVVEKYSREHLEDHTGGEDICLFNAGSEREVLMEDELWEGEEDEDLIADVASILWAEGFIANHGR